MTSPSRAGVPDDRYLYRGFKRALWLVIRVGRAGEVPSWDFAYRGVPVCDKNLSLDCREAFEDTRERWEDP